MAAAPAAIEMLENDAWIPFPTPLAVFPTFFKARSCFAALFSASRAAFVYALSSSLTSFWASFSLTCPTFFKPLIRFWTSARYWILIVLFTSLIVLSLLLLVGYKSICQFFHKLIHVLFGWLPHCFI